MTKDEQEFEYLMERRAKRRAVSDDRALDTLSKQMIAAEYLIGELHGENGKRFYVNVRNVKGDFIGRVREFPLWIQAFDYLVRNNYV